MHKTMVFIEKVLLLCCLCCLPILLSIVMPINCNKFNSEIDQSLKRFPRQVNANNGQQIGANDSHSLENFGTSIQTGFDVHQGGKNVMHDKLTGPVLLPSRNNERRGRQLNIYSQAQATNGYSYQDYASQPWYLANKEYYDNYYANYYQSYYQTTTEPIRPQQRQQQSYPSQVASFQPNSVLPISHNQQQYPSQGTSQSNQQSSLNRLNSGGTSSSTLALNGDDGDSRIYIDENGIFQITKSNSLNAVSPLIDDDAIVFQSDESQYDRRTFFPSDGKQARMNIDGDSNSKTISFNGLPVFSN